jgi:hypothetical protein
MVDGEVDSSAASIAVAHAALPLSSDTVLHSAAQYSNSPTTQSMVLRGYGRAAGSGAATSGDGSVASAAALLSTHTVVDTLPSSSRDAYIASHGGANAYEDDNKTGPQPSGASMPRTTAQERMLERMRLLLAPRPRSTNSTSNSASSTHIGDARIDVQSKKASLLDSVCHCLTIHTQLHTHA